MGPQRYRLGTPWRLSALEAEDCPETHQTSPMTMGREGKSASRRFGCFGHGRLSSHGGVSSNVTACGSSGRCGCALAGRSHRGHHGTRCCAGAADERHRAARDLARQPVGAAPQERPSGAIQVPGDRGRVALSPLGGTIDHRGGILFINVKTGKTIEVSRFTIDLTHADLTGIVNGNPKARVPLFQLDLSHAKLGTGNHVITARGVVLKLTSVAAKALNASLGTKLFSAGLQLGTARTVLRF